jgi:prepilin-type N-terminal cleavage/methylation domain-containing protein
MLPARHASRGFTLTEIMIVVIIIGLLCALAIPAFYVARISVQNTRFINDLRVASHAFEQYIMEHRTYPPDRTPGQVPPGMADYLRGMKWTQVNSIGGQWDWDYQQFGCKAGVSVYFGSRNEDARMTEIDRRIDDGKLSTGQFRKRSQGYIYIIEF